MVYKLSVECDTKQEYDALIEFMSKNKSDRQDKEKAIKDFIPDIVTKEAHHINCDCKYCKAKRDIVNKMTYKDSTAPIEHTE